MRGKTCTSRSIDCRASVKHPEPEEGENKEIVHFAGQADYLLCEVMLMSSIVNEVTNHQCVDA